MNNGYQSYPWPNYGNPPLYNPYYPNPFGNPYAPFPNAFQPVQDGLVPLKDYGPRPFVVDIDEVAKRNRNYRTALWTGKHLQVTLMSIKVRGDIGLEVHPNLDQFIRIEEGEGIVEMGDRKDRLDYKRRVYDDFAIMIPAGKWHNVINTGNKPLKLYAIYAPPEHPRGTVHETKESALSEEHHGH